VARPETRASLGRKSCGGPRPKRTSFRLHPRTRAELLDISDRYKTAKITKYKHEHFALACTYKLASL